MSRYNDEEIKIAIEVWKKTIDVQQHFNEICMKIRNVYVTLLAALIALLGAILVRAEDPFFYVFGFQVHSAAIVLFAILVGSLLFYFIDLHWYHRLLVGSVKNGLDLESKFPEIFGSGLTKSIGDNSPLDLSSASFENWFLYRLALVLRTDTKRVRDTKKLHSDAKLAIFYKSVAYLALIVLILTCIYGGIKRPEAVVTRLPEVTSTQG